MNSLWQGDIQSEGVVCSVLLEVFSWLDHVQLSACSQVCRIWNRAASEPQLWRHLLLQKKSDSSWLKALSKHSEWKRSWREEYISTVSRWEITKIYHKDEDGTFCQGALSTSGDLFAAVDTYCQLYIFKGYDWQKIITYSITDCVIPHKIEWSPDDRNIMVVGKIFNYGNFQINIYGISDIYSVEQVSLSKSPIPIRVVCTASCGRGMGCWINNECFLSLETKMLTDKISVIKVWTNSASQHTSDEHTGVAAPLFTIYNEKMANIRFVLVATVPKNAWDEEQNNDDLYYRMMFEKQDHAACDRDKLMVGACAEKGSPHKRALCAWRLGETTPPDIVVGCSLAERVLRRRSNLESFDGQPPTEEEVRRKCRPPEAICRLSHQITGLVAHRGCVWASLNDNGKKIAVCVALPRLTVLRTLFESIPILETNQLHDLAVSDNFIISYSRLLITSTPSQWEAHMAVWSTASGAVLDFVPGLTKQQHVVSIALPQLTPHSVLVLHPLKLCVYKKFSTKFDDAENL